MKSYLDIIPEDIRNYIYCIANNLRKHDNIVKFINNNFEYKYYSDYFFGHSLQRIHWSKLKVSRRKTYSAGVFVEYRSYNYYPMGGACRIENIRAAFGSNHHNYDYILNSVDGTQPISIELYDDNLSCIKATGITFT